MLLKNHNHGNQNNDLYKSTKGEDPSIKSNNKMMRRFIITPATDRSVLLHHSILFTLRASIAIEKVVVVIIVV